MRDLQPHSALDGHPPLAIWPWRVAETALDRVTAIHPYPDQRSALSDALKAAHGMALPAAGKATGRAGNRCLALADGAVLLVSDRSASSKLRPHAALFDQSDAWVCLSVSGDGKAAALDPLTRCDLRSLSGKRGETRWTDLAGRGVLVHQQGSAMDLYVPRSCAVEVYEKIAAGLVMASVFDRHRAETAQSDL